MSQRASSAFARAFAGALALLVAGGLALGQPATRRHVETERAIVVHAQPVESFDPRDQARRRFGSLQYRGGLVLTSSDKDFGGISALRTASNGQFLAVTDKGNWVTGRITYRGTTPVGIANARIGPVLGPDGLPLARRGWYDTEALAQDGDTVYLGLERVNRVLRFDMTKLGLAARGQPLDVPEISDLVHNKGLEALVHVPSGGPLAGTLIGFAERSLDSYGRHRAFLIDGPTPGSFVVTRRDGFDISDAALLPHHVLLLERKFSWLTGIAIRIRQLALADLRPGAVVDGPVLFEADFGYQIDNMEGLSIDTSGPEPVLTMISDDNFSPLQRTLLLQFTLVGNSAEAPVR